MISYPVGVGDLTTRVLEVGSTADPAVVFLHGVSARADRFARNLEAAAAAGFRALAVDLPGHGFATKGEGVDHSASGFARFVEQLAAVLGLERPLLVGTSFGAHVAGTVACRRVLPVEGLVLIGAVGIVPVGAEVRERIAGSLRRQSPADVRAKLERVLGAPEAVTPELVREESCINTSPGAATSFEQLARYFEERLDDDAVGEELRTQKIPTLVVWGAEDRSVPPAIGEATAACLDAPYEVIAAAGHVPYFEQAARFNELMARFLHSITAASPSATDVGTELISNRDRPPGVERRRGRL